MTKAYLLGFFTVLTASLTLSSACSKDTTNSSDDDDDDGDDDDDDDDDDDEDDDDEGSSFLDDNDSVTISVCDVWEQDCPEGDKCVAYADSGTSTWNANKCVEVGGSKAPGDSCTYGGAEASTDDCDENSWCWEVTSDGGELKGYCTAFCTGNALEPQCDEGVCSIANNGTITLCMAPCDPVLQDCARETQGCYLDGSSFVCAASPPDELAQGEGDPCEFINDCAPGNTCVNAEALPGCDGEACCSAWCDVNLEENPCTVSGTECVTIWNEGEAPPDQAHIGVCAEPA